MADKPVLTLEERRARREARRIKQREANLGRAADMHQARLEAGQQAVLLAATTRPAEEQEVHIGCSGWFYWHWRGDFYPADLPTSEWFAHYMKSFETVELNAPFYSWPTLATVSGWLQQAGPKKFVYTVKVCELITHVKRFVGTKELVRDFGHIADLLGPYMGCFLFQLPPSYTYTPARLKAIWDSSSTASAMSSNSATRRGGTKRSSLHSARPGPFSVHAAVPGCPTNWSRLQTTSTSGSTAPSVGIGMTTPRKNSQSGQIESGKAPRSACGFTSTMTATDTHSRMQRN
jgi:hypothetical protein